MRPARVVIGLGSSLGDRAQVLDLAVAAIAALPGTRLCASSRTYRTHAEGPARGWFLNGAVLVETTRSPRGLLRDLQAIERRLGRRPAARWHDRTLDLDLLVVEGCRRRGAALSLPHPRLCGRRFALEPAREVAPGLRLPGDGRPLAAIPDPPGPAPIPVGLLPGPLAAARGGRYHRPPREARAMKIFLDTANIAEIKEAHSWGVIDGVTTNPSLIAREGRDFVATIAEICEIVKGPVSAETVATDAAGMVREGRLLAQVSEHVVVKVPLTKEGLKATRTLSDEGIDVNVTLCFQANQALLAAKAGAAYVSPFLGRLDDISHDGVELIRQITEIYGNYPELGTEVLAASIRHPIHMTAVAQAGADVATLPFKVLAQLFDHPLTEIGLQKFLADWAKVPDPDVCGQVERWLRANGRQPR
jgi:transaldolase